VALAVGQGPLQHVFDEEGHPLAGGAGAANPVAEGAEFDGHEDRPQSGIALELLAPHTGSGWSCRFAGGTGVSPVAAWTGETPVPPDCLNRNLYKEQFAAADVEGGFEGGHNPSRAGLRRVLLGG